MSDKFTVKINCVVLTTNIALNKKYVLSIDSNKMVLPSLVLSYDNLTDNNLQDSIVQFLKQYVFVSDIELFPQLINLHSNHITTDNQTLNTVYGFLINQTNSLNNAYWIEFDYLQPVELTPLLVEVIQKLR